MYLLVEIKLNNTIWVSSEIPEYYSLKGVNESMPNYASSLIRLTIVVRHLCKYV